MKTNDVNSPAKWEEDYAQGTAGWDLGRPTPAFQRLASGSRFKPGSMIVLGAGRGHDARLFARYGFQVTAVDFAPHAAQEMERLADPNTPVRILERDLFNLPREFDGSFDYLLEYTCLCAIDPRRREEYADVVARLLKPGGTYIALAFPLDEHAGGPPFAVSLSEIFSLFGARGFTLLSRETPGDSVPQRRGLEELLTFSKTQARKNLT